MKRMLTFSFIFLFQPFHGMGQDFSASVNPETVPAGKQFTVTFTYSGTETPDSRGFKAPDFAQFVVMSGPNTSTNMQWINGRMRASVTYSYYLYAREPGTYTIGAATYTYNGTTYTTSPIKVTVTQGGATPEKASQPAAGESAENLFIRAIPSTRRVRQGEQLTLVYKLYTRVGISNFALSRVPTYEGFWSEEFELPQPPQVTTETYNGKQYRTVTLRKVALFATQTGSLRLEPLVAKCAVQVQQRRRPNDPFDIFNDPFFSRFQTVEQDVASNPLTITVSPLPPGAPETFNGAVGQYTFSATIDKTEVQAGNPLTLTVKVSGKGNVQLLRLPEPKLPADVEQYEPKVTDNVTPQGESIGGSKTAEYLLIPRNEGRRAIDPLVFTYYDLAKERYVTLRSPRFDFTITPGKAIAGGSTPLVSKEDIRLLGEDIRFLKLEMGNIRGGSEAPYESPIFLLTLLASPIAFIAAYAHRKRQERIRGNVVLWRSQKAGREATKRLKAAKKILNSGDTESYHAEVSRSIVGYLSDRLRIPLSSLSMDVVADRLKKRGISDAVVGQLRESFERAEFARFAPRSDTHEGRKDLLAAVGRVIDALEENLRD